MIKRGNEHADVMRKIDRLRPGIRVHMRTLNNRHTGFVKRIDPDQLFLLTDEGRSLVITFAAIVSIDNVTSANRTDRGKQ